MKIMTILLMFGLSLPIAGQAMHCPATDDLVVDKDVFYYPSGNRDFRFSVQRDNFSPLIERIVSVYVINRFVGATVQYQRSRAMIECHYIANGQVTFLTLQAQGPFAEDVALTGNSWRQEAGRSLCEDGDPEGCSWELMS